MALVVRGLLCIRQNDGCHGNFHALIAAGPSNRYSVYTSIRSAQLWLILNLVSFLSSFLMQLDSEPQSKLLLTTVSQIGCDQGNHSAVRFLLA